MVNESLSSVDVAIASQTELCGVVISDAKDCVPLR